MTSKLVGVLAVGLMLAATAGVASAVTVSWNTSSSCIGAGTCAQTAGSVGDPQEWTFTATGGQVLTARAFQLADDGSGTFVQVRINLFSGGIGAGTESSPEHAVDNIGPDEMVVFRFGQDTYVPLSAHLGYVNGDSDVKAYVGGADPPITFGSFTGFGWGTFVPTDWDPYTTTGADLSGSSATRTVNLNKTGSNLDGRYLILAAANAGYDEDDKFKIDQVVGEISDVPEPATLLLLGSGLVGLGAWARRRRQG